MAKHKIYELKQKQSLPLEQKIIITKRRLEEWFNYWDNPPRERENIVSFSGGKDSTVLLHIARQIKPDIKAVYIDTGLEFPEIKQFVKSHENVDIIRPEMTFRQVLDKYGYPFPSKEVSRLFVDYLHGSQVAKQKFDRMSKNNQGNLSKFNIAKKWQFLKNLPPEFYVSHKCCDIMKKNVIHKYLGKNKVSITGTMACESRLRQNNWLKTGCNVFESRHPLSQPMSFWLEHDVLEYLVKYNVPYCKEVYGDIVCENGRYKTTKASRTGCMFCLFGIASEKRPNRLDMIKQEYPKIYDYIMKSKAEGGLGYHKFLNYVGIEHDWIERKEE